MERLVNILLIEDDELDQIDIKRTLARKNILYRIKIARNGEDALHLLKNDNTVFEGKPDLIIMDLNMPKMNGAEFLSRLRRDDQLKDIKVFVLTTSEEPSDRESVLKLGAAGFITKPLKLESPSSRDAFNLMIDLMNIRP